MDSWADDAAKNRGVWTKSNLEYPFYTGTTAERAKRGPAEEIWTTRKRW